MSRRSAPAFLGAVLLACLLTIATPAQAHNYLVSSTPAEGEVLTALPAEFSVTTNESLLALDGATSGFALQVVDSAGSYYGDGCLTASGATLSTATALGLPGDYRLIWQVVSADGHPVSGEFAFSWRGDASAATRGSATPPVCGETVVEPLATSTPEVAPEPSVTAVPIVQQEVRPNASLSDVLWVGGAILAVLAAGVVTFLVIGRRSSKTR